MILPKGKLKEIAKYVKPSKFFGSNFTGYLQFSWKDAEKGLCLGSVLLVEGKPVLAGVEYVSSKKEVKGNEALKAVLDVGEVNVEVYELDWKEVELALEMNKDARVNYEVFKKEESKGKSEHKPEEVNLSKFLSTLGNFTGIVKAEGPKRKATLALRNGEVVAAKVIDGDKIFFGEDALNRINFVGKISVKETSLNTIKNYEEKSKMEELEQSGGNIRELIMKKYRIKEPSEEDIQKIIKKIFED